MPFLLKQARGLYAITDCDNLGEAELLQQTEQILKAGARILQYRDKKNDADTKLKLAKQLLELCKYYQTPLIINDDVELTRKAGADGVHIGKEDTTLKSTRSYLGRKIIGVSCYNNLDLAIKAQQSGADYIAFGSFFPSNIKPDAVRADKNILNTAKKILQIPIVAIGGISPENGAPLLEAGADYLAVISGLYQSSDVCASANAYINLF